jgi:hypothetical protein
VNDIVFVAVLDARYEQDLVSACLIARLPVVRPFSSGESAAVLAHEHHVVTAPREGISDPAQWP